jgi:hypothetical protein
MTALLVNSREVKLLTELAESHGTVTGSSGCLQLGDHGRVPTIETIHARANVVTPVLKKILEIRPPPHWGINE